MERHWIDIGDDFYVSKFNYWFVQYNQCVVLPKRECIWSKFSAVKGGAPIPNCLICSHWDNRCYWKWNGHSSFRKFQGPTNKDGQHFSDQPELSGFHLLRVDYRHIYKQDWFWRSLRIERTTGVYSVGTKNCALGFSALIYIQSGGYEHWKVRLFTLFSQKIQCHLKFNFQCNNSTKQRQDYIHFFVISQSIQKEEVKVFFEI